MTTQTTTETQAPATPKAPKALSYATLGGAVLSFASTFLAWTWTAEFPGNLTVDGYPGGLQLLTLTGALLTAVLVLGGLGIPGLRWATPAASTPPSASWRSPPSPPPGSPSSPSPSNSAAWSTSNPAPGSPPSPPR